MKITIVIGAFLPVPAIEGGAVEKMWYLIANEFGSQGHSVKVLSKQHLKLKDYEKVKNVEYIRLKGFETPKSGWVLKICDLLYTLRTLKHIKSDIVVSNTFWLPFFLRSKKKGLLCVDVARMPKGQMRFYKHVARLRSNSTAVKKAILHEVPNMQAKVSMIPNPLTFLTSEKDINLDGKDKTILYVGRVHPEKGIDILINAFSEACDKGLTDYKLRIIGPHKFGQGGGGEDYLKELKSKVKELTKIEFVGPIYNAEKLNDEYRRASVFVYPSIAEKGETFGIAPLEGMAWGCIPIVSNLDCFKDFITSEKNGFIFNHREKTKVIQLADYLLKLDGMTDDELVVIRKECLKVRKTHNIPVISAMFLDDFKKMLDDE